MRFEVVWRRVIGPAGLTVLLAGCGGGEVRDETPAATGGARNVILLIGDGMGVSTVTAARILAGQLAGGSGEENLLSFERFPHVALAKTYNTDMQVPDSAGTMSAMVTGRKTRAGVLSVAPETPRGDCRMAQPMTTILEAAEQAGMATGLVTTTRITHATPAALYAHAADRNWEDDAALPAAARDAGCADIARQWVEFPAGDGPDVVFGGGRAQFQSKIVADPEYPEYNGRRLDGRDLIHEWQKRRPGSRYVWNRANFEQLDLTAPGPILGLFEPSHLHYEHDRGGDRAGEPSLSEMTRAAIAHLTADPDGFFLMVEGGRIDHAHHDGNAYRALTETIEFSRAVEVALAMTSRDDTLIVVTADHSHVLAIAGYPARGNPILGKVVGIDGRGARQAAPAPAADGKPYTTLAYANGPGYTAGGERPDLSAIDTADPDYRPLGGVPLAAETHGGEDVAVYAIGPGAEAVHGVLEQNRIFDVLVDAAPRLRGDHGTE